MSKSRINRPTDKVNKNSLGQFLRKLQRIFWTSAFITPEHKKEVTDKAGVVHTITVPRGVRKPGHTYTKPEA